VADEASQRRVCRMVGLFAEGAYTTIRSSSGTATVHTASEQCQCFQIPDSLQTYQKILDLEFPESGVCCPVSGFSYLGL